MTHLNIQDEVKKLLDHLKKEHARGRGDHDMSHTEFQKYLISLIPQSKTDELFNLFQKFNINIKLTLQVPDEDGDIESLVSLWFTTLAGSYDNPKKLKSYVQALKDLVAQKGKEFPPKLKRRKPDE